MKQRMLRHLLVSIGFTLVFVDHYFVASFIRNSNTNSCSLIGFQRCKTELMQQKKRAPVGGEFIELGSSLITLLNLAQEIGSSNNLRFRQAADKLRDQFARSFALRYDLEKSQFLSSALSSIDGDSQLTTAQRAIQTTVMAQLKGIERKASSIIFFNEPLGNLNEFQYPFSFPYDALEPLAKTPDDMSGPSVGSSSDDSLSSAEQSQESAEAEAIRKRDARNLQFFRDRIPGIAGNRYRDDDIRKLKLGLQVETRKWRAEAAKLMRTRGQQYSVGVNSNDKPWTDEGTSSRNAVAASDSSSPADDWNNRFRPLAFDPPIEGQGQGVGKGPGAVAGSVSSSESRQRRQHQRASGGRWRASLELIDSARARARGAGVGTEDPDMDADMDADVDEAESVPKRGGTGGSWGGLGESDAASTNYALLIHSCLLLSLSTYNLKLTGDWIDFAFDIDSERAIEKISEAVSKAADAFMNMNMSGRRESSSTAPFGSPSNSNSAGSVKLPPPSDSLNDADMARTQALVFKALGGSSFPRDALFVQTIHSEKACAVMLYDQRRNTVIIAFRGTKDPVDVITDITFFSTAFAPRPVVKSDARNAGSFSSNAAVLISRDPLPTLPLQSQPSPLKGESDSDSAGGYPDGMEVHTGFLSSFESIRVKIDTALARLNITERAEASSRPTVLLTGHSMGGALAQIAAAYYSDLKPSLVTFATPSIGNEEFCSFVNKRVHPAGGLRVWNEYDAIPYIALLVGYQHAGVPIKTRLKKNAKDLFQNVSVNTIAAALDVVSPHILFQIGSLIHVFPVIGSEIGSKHVPFAPSAEASPDFEYLQGSSVRSPPVPPPAPTSPSPVESLVASESISTMTSASYAATTLKDQEGGSGGEEQGEIPAEGATERERELQVAAAAVSTEIPQATLAVAVAVAVAGSTEAPSPDSAPLLSSPGYGDSSAPSTSTESTGLTDSDAAKKSSFFGIDFDRMFGRRLVEDEDAQTGEGGVGEGVGAMGGEGSGGLSIGTAASPATTDSGSSGPGAVRGYSYTAEELEQEEADGSAGAVAGVAQTLPLPLDSRVGAKSSKEFPEHPAFQPVFSTVKKDKAEDFTPDSYYDQFINEKQYFLSSDQVQVGAGGTKVGSTDGTGGEGERGKKGGKGEDKSALNLSYQVRRILRELEAEAVFSEIDNSARRGIMLRIWEEIKDSEATLITSLGKQAEEGEEEDDDEDDDEDEEEEEAEG